MSANNGYIGRSPGDSAVIVARESFTPGAATTDFTMSGGYTVGYLDCYLNGSRLIYGTDYTASNGSTVGLTSFAQSGDVVELVAYKAFNVASVSEASGNFTVGTKLTVSGISSLGDVVSSGIVTADSFSGNLTGASVSSSGPLTISDTTASTTTSTGSLIVSGGVGIAKSIFVGEGISVAGTITYNDVTNIDSIGFVTAGKGLRATAGGLIVTAGVTTIGAKLSVAGITSLGDVVSSGIITADSYYGSGANLTNIDTGVAGVSTTGFSTFTTVSVGGISTFVGLVTAGNVVSSGIITATAFIPSQGQLSNRNLIVNGAMTVAQRGLTTTGTGYGTVDRFQIGYGGHDEVITTTQHSLTSSDTGPWGEGFRKSYHVQNGNQTGGADAADYCQIVYRPEGQDINRSGWHFTDPNSKVTLSFWIQSSVAQNFYGFIEGSTPTRIFPFESGTLTADTWKKVSVTIPGYASLAIPDTTATAFSLAFLPFYGTGYTSASARAVGSWYDSTPYCPNNTSTWWTTNDSTFEITGIQLEVGSVATPFEHRKFQDDVYNCQRYYQQVGKSGQDGDFCIGASHLTSNGDQTRVGYYGQNNLRATPTITEFGDGLLVIGAASKSSTVVTTIDDIDVDFPSTFLQFNCNCADIGDNNEIVVVTNRPDSGIYINAEL